MKIRIKFKKSGVMKFIGHLDIMRYFQKAMRRSKIDIAYSAGFSPHQIMSFASPLGVGIISNGEYLDIEVKSTLSSEKSIKALNDVMVEGIEILSYVQLSEDEKNAMSIVAAADYTLLFQDKSSVTELFSNSNFENKVKEFYEQESIVVLKKTKKSERELDIKPLIYKLEVMNTEGKKGIFMQVAAGSVENLKPELVFDTLMDFCNLPKEELTYQTIREELYALSTEEASTGFVSLDASGEWIHE